MASDVMRVRLHLREIRVIRRCRLRNPCSSWMRSGEGVTVLAVGIAPFNVLPGSATERLVIVCSVVGIIDRIIIISGHDGCIYCRAGKAR